jgi:hypothetical protein
MVHWEQSYKFGKAQELRIHPVIQEHFQREITPTEEQYAKYDFYDEKTNYEVKSRTNTYNRYPDTMITMNKCCICDEGKDLILLFNFIDGLYYIKFDPEQFKNYRKELFSRAREDWDEKEHIFIPIEDLTLIKKWELPNTIPALSKSGGF